MAPHHLALRIKAQREFADLMDLPWDQFIASVGNSEKIQIKKRVILEQEGRCSHCGIHEWMGQPITFELEHKDGSHHNDSRENLEALCPNCHSLTPTWRGKNKKSHQQRVSDEQLIEALKKYSSIRQALLSVGMAGKGNNYNRANYLKKKIQSGS